jgi:hypothetical protein
MALAMLGAELIREFDKRSKAARICETLFPIVRDDLLLGYDWSCARGIEALRESVGIDSNEFGTAYDIPIDCLHPRDILPVGTRQQWHKVGSVIHTNVSTPGLQYTKKLTDPGSFNQAFVSALIAQLASTIAPAVIGDVKLSNQFVTIAQNKITFAQESDAGVGSDYRNPDVDPENDTFVNPDAGLMPFGSLEEYYGTR